ncbi:hypothetical protein F2Q70_00029970 [Brassica cretica]|uniref:Uncharacterized protein n=2 Tax=Brassica cretica TaxID=69181 RepID=A0A3N6TI66_BRACR|nr:hypothetical protein F2Q70_00029970 [Brassica cretica]KAF3489811.1 hypothetical protein F2Q69_00053237 [Brassica cretica]KAF3597203.1 hypothetical protein DY000_02022258 [Brassica cretica]
MERFYKMILKNGQPTIEKSMAEIRTLYIAFHSRKQFYTCRWWVDMFHERPPRASTHTDNSSYKRLRVNEPPKLSNREKNRACLTQTPRRDQKPTSHDHRQPRPRQGGVRRRDFHSASSRHRPSKGLKEP